MVLVETAAPSLAQSHSAPSLPASLLAATSNPGPRELREQLLVHVRRADRLLRPEPPHPPPQQDSAVPLQLPLIAAGLVNRSRAELLHTEDDVDDSRSIDYDVPNRPDDLGTDANGIHPDRWPR